MSDLPRRAFVALALGLPFALLFIHRGLGHEGDLDFFFDWYLAFREGPAFYRDGPGLNYPIVGVLLVCGPARLVEGLLGRVVDASEYRLIIKGTLVVGEVALIFAAAALGRAMRAPRPHVLALCLFLLPSTWVGGAWFGQIDVIGSALLLASTWGLVRYRQRGELLHLVLGVAALHAALLSKQLTWFAVPGLLWLLVLGLKEHGSTKHAGLAILSVSAWFVVDPFLDLPDGYVSHLWFVVAGGGSSHGSLVVATGASVWSLFDLGGVPSDSLRWGGLDSFVWGWIGWAAAVAIAAALRLRRPTDRALVGLAGISHLAMATLLTGVHERYLVHAIPLLFLAGFGAPRVRRALAIAVAGLCGVFVLASITPWLAARVGPLTRPIPLAIASLAWLLVELRPVLPTPVTAASSAADLHADPTVERASRERMADRTDDMEGTA